MTNSRLQKRANQVWRRRVCQECMATVTTHEAVALESAIVVTQKSAHQPFSRDKLFISIYECCKHRKDALTSSKHLTDTIIAMLYPLIHNAGIPRDKIVATTTKTLKNFDNAAAVQYTAYHPSKS